METDLLWSELLNASMISGAMLAVIAVVDLVGRLTSLPVEHTRKMAHFFGGVAIVTVPWELATTWAPLLFTVGFFLFMDVSRRMGWLDSVHGVARVTSGAALYPLGVCAALFVAGGNTPIYKMAILVMASSDALAAIVGQAVGRHPYRVLKQWRSLEGSSAFFVSAVVILGTGLVLIGVPLGAAIALALVVAALVTLCEAVSQGGSDNVLVPVATAGLVLLLLPAAS
jgi:dolichol kinase